MVTCYIHCFESLEVCRYTQTQSRKLIALPDKDDDFDFICSHRSPISWDIIPSDPRLIFDVVSKYEAEYNQYIAKIQVLPNFNNTVNISLILTCRTVAGEDLKCTALSIIYRRNKTYVVYTGLQYTTYTIPSSPVMNMDSNCDVVLLYWVKGVETNRSLEYKWQGQRVETRSRETVTTTSSIDYFKSLYPTDSQTPSCVRKMNADDPCKTDCKVIHGYDGSVVFYRENGKRCPFLAKGMFGVTSNPDHKMEFYWDWNVSFENMVKIEAPSVFFVNKAENITCTISDMVFLSSPVVFNIQSLSLVYGEGMWKEHVYRGMTRYTQSIEMTEERKEDAVLCTVYPIRSLGNFSITRNVSVETPRAPKILHKVPLPNIAVNKGEHKKFTCKISGKPRPIVHWMLPNEVSATNIKQTKKELDTWVVESSLEIFNFQLDQEGTYKCIGRNYISNVSSTFQLQLHQQQVGMSGVHKTSLGLGLGSVIVFLAIVLAGLNGMTVLLRQKYRRKTFTVKQEFLDGISLEKEVKEDNKSLIVHNPTFLAQPFNDELNVPFNCWIIDGAILGIGNFGLVRKGRVKLLDGEVHVAVKTLRSIEDIEDFRRFLYELKLMQCIGLHPNIVSLVATCVDRIDERDVMIGVELCLNGSVENYLHKHASKFRFTFPREFSNKKSEDKTLSTTKTSTHLYTNLEEYNDLIEVDLYKWSFQIASGMEFLASKLVLHGDLAARNVLLNGDKVAKICDFGLSRHLDENAKYEKKSTVGVPWKYLAIESLTSRVYSTSSDVWAYGVTLWEIFSLGESPYPGLRMGKDFINQLTSGMRLKKPELATNFVYEMMVECWHENPKHRPTFTQLLNEFEKILEDLKFHRQLNVTKKELTSTGMD